MCKKNGNTLPLSPATILVVLALALAGCPKQPEVGETQPAGPAAASKPAAPAPGPGGRESRVAAPPAPRETTVPPAAPVRSSSRPPAASGPATTSPLKDVYFDYDKALLTDDAKRILNGDIAWLKANPRIPVVVEGHCDERGTAEYNLALGERRARTVREYLVGSGVEVSRIRTISYGKERPVNPGHDEAAWRWNRRAHMVVGR